MQCSLFNYVLISVIVWAGPPTGCYQKGAKEDIEREEAIFGTDNFIFTPGGL